MKIKLSPAEKDFVQAAVNEAELPKTFEVPLQNAQDTNILDLTLQQAYILSDLMYEIIDAGIEAISGDPHPAAENINDIHLATKILKEVSNVIKR